MAGVRPGGLSDDENSDEDQLIDCDETFRKQYLDSNNATASLPSQHGFVGYMPVNGTTYHEDAHSLPIRNSSSSLPAKYTNPVDAVPAVWCSTADDLVNADDFRLAVMKNDLKLIETFLKCGIDVNILFNTGWTALMYAAQNAAPETIDFLIRHGANPNVHKGTTTLIAACNSKTDSESMLLTCVNKLLMAGADPTATDQYNMTPLMYAAREGRLTVVESLLAVTNDINCQDNKGFTALMWACAGGQIGVVKLLLNNGADASKQKHDGKRAVDIAAFKKHRQIVELLGGSELGTSEVSVTSADSPSRPSNSCSEVTASDTVSPANKAFNSQSADFLSHSSSSMSRLESTGRLSNVGDSCESLSLTQDRRGASSLRSKPSTGVPQPASANASNSSNTLSDAGLSNYGELEMFLSGIDLSSLIPLFKQQQVSFTTFLRLTDSDLQKMGIEQIGIRKKILDTIRDTHKKNWETSSLASLQYNKKISCSEAVVMLANIRQHAAYIASTIGYVDDQIAADTRIVTDASQDRGVGVKDLCINTEEAMTNVKNLYTELSSLRRHLEKVCYNRDFRLPELVSSRQSRTRNRWRRRLRRAAVFAAFVAGCSAVFVMLGKTDHSIKT